MQFQLHKFLEKSLKNNALPSIIVYNRIDGPGSSLDLREFQQALWRLLSIPEAMKNN